MQELSFRQIKRNAILYLRPTKSVSAFASAQVPHVKINK